MLEVRIMKNPNVNKHFFLDIIRTTIIAVIISLVLVLVFALIVNLVDVGESVIMPVNQVIKLLSVLAACFVGFKDNKQGAFKGALSGLCYTLLSILVFGLISKEISFNLMKLVDVALGIVAGAISGILAVNLRKKSVA